MARTVTLLDDRVRLVWDGTDAALVLRQSLEIPFATIDSVEVGFGGMPSAWTWRRVGTSNPLSKRRQGYFWHEGKSLFLDVRRDPANTLVLRLRPGSRFDVVAWDGEQSAELAPALREKLDAAS
jgi:hypothetical protein